MKILNKTLNFYLLSSLIAFTLDIVLFTIILFFINNYISNAILIASYLARVISSIFNYFFNKKVVFKNKIKRNYKAFLGYIVLVFINTTLSGLFVTRIYSLIYLNPSFIKVVVDTILFIVNFFFQKFIIFKK